MTTSECIAAAGVVVAAVGVIGTWAIAALALWGDWFKSWFPFLGPALTIEPVGLSDLITQNNGLKARYYFLRVKNARPRQFPAHEVLLLITRVEKPDAAGRPITVFGEPVALTWVRQETFGNLRTIGWDADANLLWVREDGWFQFELMGPGRPNHFPPPQASGRADFWVTVQARSIEADSQPRRFKVAWDGQWQEGTSEIGKHLVVSLDPPIDR